MGQDREEQSETNAEAVEGALEETTGQSIADDRLQEAFRQEQQQGGRWHSELF